MVEETKIELLKRSELFAAKNRLLKTLKASYYRKSILVYSGKSFQVEENLLSFIGCLIQSGQSSFVIRDHFGNFINIEDLKDFLNKCISHLSGLNNYMLVQQTRIENCSSMEELYCDDLYKE